VDTPAFAVFGWNLAATARKVMDNGLEKFFSGVRPLDLKGPFFFAEMIDSCAGKDHFRSGML